MSDSAMDPLRRLGAKMSMEDGEGSSGDREENREAADRRETRALLEVSTALACGVFDLVM